VTTPTWSTLSIDTSLALRTAASRLADEFIGTFGTETIERFLHSSYDQLAQQAAVTKFLPLMAERFARERLPAVAKLEGLHRDGKPTVLFLCTHNAGRSQMALGFFERASTLSNQVSTYASLLDGHAGLRWSDRAGRAPFPAWRPPWVRSGRIRHRPNGRPQLLRPGACEQRHHDVGMHGGVPLRRRLQICGLR